MYQAAVFPSLTDSTVVLATPAKSPPQKTPGALVSIVSLLISAVPHLVSLTGSRALITMRIEIISNPVFIFQISIKLPGYNGIFSLNQIKKMVNLLLNYIYNTVKINNQSKMDHLHYLVMLIQMPR